MIKHDLIINFLLTFFICIGACQAQRTITIKFVGNCGLHLTDGNIDLYADFPYKSGAFGYMDYDELTLDSVADNAIYIFTHKHADHYSRSKMEELIKNDNASDITPWNSPESPEIVEINEDLKIRLIRTKHRLAKEHFSYLISWHDKKIYLSGDTERSKTISEMVDLDWAFVPMWILKDAKVKGRKIDAEHIGVYHLYPNQIDRAISNFQNEARITPLVRQGQTFTIKY